MKISKRHNGTSGVQYAIPVQRYGFYGVFCDILLRDSRAPLQPIAV